MALGDGGDQAVDLARQFSEPSLQASTPCIGIGCKAPSFLLIGLDVMGNYVRMAQLGGEAGQDRSFDGIQIERLGIRANSAFRGGGTADANTLGLVDTL
ncbi:hypothetical protein X768_06265 [Mesorhizobium sp. LSJC265A00]|nr:hypothetical protein X768_06265 [Mesorhizobium sp. LSJC265A00]